MKAREENGPLSSRQQPSDSCQPSSCIACNSQRQFDIACEAAVTTALLLVVRNNRRHTWWRSRKCLASCEDLVGAFFLHALRTSSTKDTGIFDALQKMHEHCRNRLHILEQTTWKLEPHPREWMLIEHKMFAALFAHSVAAKKGNDGMFHMLRNPDAKLHDLLSVRDKIVAGENDVDMLCSKWLTRSMPRPKSLPLEHLHLNAIHSLRRVSLCPADTMEEKNMDLIALLLERYVVDDFPLDVLLLVSDLSGKQVDAWKKLRKARDEGSVKQWNDTVTSLPTPYQRYVRFTLCLYKRHCQFVARHVCPRTTRVKCTRSLTEADLSALTVTVCEFCRECITYFDMGTRPPSFGHFLNAELHLLSSFEPQRFVNLEFAHPDRHSFVSCQGKRTCFAMVGYPQKICNQCLEMERE